MLVVFKREMKCFTFSALKSKCEYIGIWYIGINSMSDFAEPISCEGNVLKFIESYPLKC